jgi:hypothetical protein
MSYENEEFPIENFAEFIQKMITESILVLKSDAHIKLISIKFPFITANDFFKKIIKIDVLTDIIEKHVPSNDCGFSKDRYVNPEIIKLIINDITSEMKTRMFSELSNMNKMALFYDKKNDKCFWSFMENRPIHDEKDILNKKSRRNK